MAAGPLRGFRFIEFAGIGPGPFCAMLLADLGADIIRVDRKDLAGTEADAGDVLARGRRSIALDLKDEKDKSVALSLVASAHGLIEGFRPGVMERLGLAPEDCWKVNPKLIYGRMTGWGQNGPLAASAGHDLNYIALSGALHSIGVKEKPSIPLNLIGDFGGGALYLAFGLCAALLEAQHSQKGQVVDMAMCDGAVSLMSMFFGWHAAGKWTELRGSNLLDGGAPFYNIYETSDGLFVTIAAIEPKFYNVLRSLLQLDDSLFDDQFDQQKWPEQKLKLAELFQQRTRQEWCDLLEATDACFAPVLSMQEAQNHPHYRHNQTFFNGHSFTQPGVVPSFSRTPGAVQGPPVAPGSHNREILDEMASSESHSIKD